MPLFLPRPDWLVESPAKRAMVSEAVVWPQAHRKLPQGDVIHLRRAEGRRLDAFFQVRLHAGMLVVDHPTDAALRETLEVPLNDTGLIRRTTATFPRRGPHREPLDELGRACVDVSVPAGGTAWVSFR